MTGDAGGPTREAPGRPGADRAEDGLPAARSGLGQRCFYWFAWGAVTCLLTLLYRFRRLHLGRFPESGPVLVVCNHQSHFDPPMIGLCVRNRQFRPLARASLFRNPVFARIIGALNAIPLRDNEGDIQAIRAALAQLRAGEVVSVFPEGSRTPDGEIKEFQRGATLLLKRARCPVVPMAIEGAFDIWPKSRALPQLWGGPLLIAVGEPIGHEELLRNGPEAALDRLRAEVEALHESLRRRQRGR